MALSVIEYLLIICLLDPSYTNIPMDILEMSIPHWKSLNAFGESLPGECATSATNARLCTSPTRKCARVVARRKDHTLYVIRTLNTDLNVFYGLK